MGEPRAVKVVLPAPLAVLAGVAGEVEVDLEGAATQRSVLDALEARLPVLRGAIRDHSGANRRAFVRFFANGEDVSHDSPDAPLPDSVAEGREAFVILGAMAGG